MAWPTSLKVALKEWAVVCRALESGRQIVLLRKGGIYESSGEFEIEHREFLLLPTYVHQNRAMIKQPERDDMELKAQEPSRVSIGAAAVVTDVVPVRTRAPIDAIDAEHIWTPPLIDMRFSYKPQNPSYLLLVRVHRLREPVTLDNTPAYAGCKSWVPLEHEIPTGTTSPVLDDVKYEFKRKALLDKVALQDRPVR
jgi:hypothetical protein